jgi:hypothetical protein
MPRQAERLIIGNENLFQNSVLGQEISFDATQQLLLNCPMTIVMQRSLHRDDEQIAGQRSVERAAIRTLKRTYDRIVFVGDHGTRCAPCIHRSFANRTDGIGCTVRFCISVLRKVGYFGKIDRLF